MVYLLRPEMHNWRAQLSSKAAGGKSWWKVPRWIKDAQRDMFVRLCSQTNRFHKPAGGQLHFDPAMTVARAATLSRSSHNLSPLGNDDLLRALNELYVRQGMLVALVSRDRVLL